MGEIKRTVYAIDDSRQIIADLKRVAKLIDGNIQVEPASSEEAGLAIVARYRRSNVSPLFLVDLRLRDSGSGFRIIKAIRRKRALKYAPIIVLTSSDSNEYVNKSYEIGANAYVVKDDDPKILPKKLEALLRFWLRNYYHDRALAKPYRNTV